MSNETPGLEPTESYKLWGGSVEVHCFGTRYGNWSLAGKTPEEAEKNNPGILERMKRVAEQFDCVMFAPNPSRFNAKIVHWRELGDEWIPNTLIRGDYADGVRLTDWYIPAAPAFAVTSSDCPTLILRDTENDEVVAAHAGRDSLIRFDDEPDLDSAMLDALRPDTKRLIGLRGFIACGIRYGHFTHPLHDPQNGERNRMLVEHAAQYDGAAWADDDEGKIDLPRLIVGHLGAHGLDDTQIGTDATDTFSDCEGGKPLWHSHRRDKNGMRNLVLVIRRR